MRGAPFGHQAAPILDGPLQAFTGRSYDCASWARMIASAISFIGLRVFMLIF